MTTREFEDLLLACKEGRCPWDYSSAPLYVAEDRYGRTVWKKTIRCYNCPSIKIEHYEPRIDGNLLWRHYDRPDGWYNLKTYWSAARRERTLRQLQTVGIHEEQVA